MAGTSALMRLRRRLVAAVAGISLVIVVVLGLDLYDTRRQAIDNARAVSESISRLLSERLDDLVREVDFVLRDLADRVSAVQGPAGAASRAELGRLLDVKRSTLPQALSLDILDSWGSPIASSPREAERVATGPYLSAFAANASLEAATQVQFLTGESALGACLIHARAVRESGGALLAVVAARVDVSRIQSELAGLQLGPEGMIAVTDPGLRIVAMKPEALGTIGLEVGDDEMRGVLRALEASAPGSGPMRSETGSHFYSAQVGEFPLLIAIGQAKSGVMNEWDRRLAIYGAAVVAILLLFGLLARLVDKNFARGAELSARLVAMESASDMIVIADLEGRAEYVNPSFERASGRPKSETIGSRTAIFGLDEEHVEAALAAVSKGESWRGEVSARRFDGASIVEEVTVAPVPGPNGSPIRIVAVLRDITERRRLQERLERLAHYDSLTALPNRALFFDRLEGAVARARREDRRFALLFIDLDGFKAINDRYGHDAGDYLLFEIARRLKAAIRDSDTAGRMGGDEFTVLLDNIAKSEDARAVASKIRASLVEPIEIPSGSKVRVGASMGLALFPEDGSEGEAILKAADSAMYADKVGGGERWEPKP